jgi:hypothetical protein
MTCQKFPSVLGGRLKSEDSLLRQEVIFHYWADSYTFREGLPLFLHVHDQTGHYKQEGPQMGALPGFGTVLGCRLRQVPYSGNAPVCRPYQPLTQHNGQGLPPFHGT